MTYSTDPADRAEFITGLRALADYLTIHQDAPVPRSAVLVQLCADRTDGGGCTQVDEFAEQHGATVEDRLAESGYYSAARSFGRIDYRMVAISNDCMARYDAEMSYSGSVIP